MCGIAGIVDYEQWHESMKPDFLQAMQETLLRRGPDQKGIWQADFVSLIHARLSIIDLDNGKQPMQRENCCMVYNGELYNSEELRQELNRVLETGNLAYIDSVMNRVFDDEMNLLRGARASRERMRMLALTTGVVSLANNGQSFTYDYGVPATHKTTTETSWSDHTNSDPIEDMRALKEQILDDTGVEVTRAMCDGATWRNIRNNEKIA